MKQILTLLLLFIITSCSQSAVIQNEGDTMKLTSPAFKESGMIPAEYTCDGKNISPELIIEGVPASAKSLALIMDDPDTPMGTWDHWIVFNIPATIKKIAKSTEPEGIAGQNSGKRTGYGSPCPPSGTHGYFFKLYALDIRLELNQGATKADLLEAMKGHVVAEARLIGKYSRS